MAFNLSVGMMIIFVIPSAASGNVAVGKMASQGPETWAENLNHHRYSNVADKAVDGNTNPDVTGDSCSHPAGGSSSNPAWWKVDLGSDHVIYNVTIINRDSSQGRLQYTDVQHSLDDTTYTSCGNTGSSLTIDQITIDCRTTKARYIRLMRQSNAADPGNMNICEVIVAGYRYDDHSYEFQAPSISNIGPNSCDVEIQLQGVGVPPDSYVIQYKVEGRDGWTDGKAVQDGVDGAKIKVTQDGLQPKTHYMFRYQPVFNGIKGTPSKETDIIITEDGPTSETNMDDSNGTNTLHIVLPVMGVVIILIIAVVIVVVVVVVMKKRRDQQPPSATKSSTDLSENDENLKNEHTGSPTPYSMEMKEDHKTNTGAKSLAVNLGCQMTTEKNGGHEKQGLDASAGLSANCIIM